MEVGRQQRAFQIHPNYRWHQFVPMLVTKSMIGRQESNSALKRVRFSHPIKKTDTGTKILKIQRELNNLAWAKAMRPLPDGGNCENSVNIMFQWENRWSLKRYIINVEYRGETRDWVQARQEPFGTVQGAE